MVTCGTTSVIWIHEGTEALKLEMDAVLSSLVHMLCSAIEHVNLNHAYQAQVRRTSPRRQGNLEPSLGILATGLCFAGVLLG